MVQVLQEESILVQIARKGALNARFRGRDIVLKAIGGGLKAEFCGFRVVSFSLTDRRRLAIVFSVTRLWEWC